MPPIDNSVFEYDSISHHIHRFKNKFGSFNLEWYTDDPESVILTALYVDETHRRKGFGGDLLNQAYDICKKLGFNKISLKVERGTWTERWYKKMGWNIWVEDDDEYAWLTRVIKED